jgi:hypothetical protein
MPWYDFAIASTITKDGSNRVSAWGDILGSGHDLVQSSDSLKPIISSTGITFDGVDDKMETGTFNIAQPISIYFVGKKITHAHNFGGLISSKTGAALLTDEYATTLALNNTYTELTRTIAAGSRMIVRGLFNGANSFLKINNATGKYGSVGTLGFTGIMIGNQPGVGNYYVNWEYTEMIFRGADDTDDNEAAIYNYLNTKYALGYP